MKGNREVVEDGELKDDGPCDRMLAEMREIPQLKQMNKQLRWSSIINTPYQNNVPLVDPIVRKCGTPYLFQVILIGCVDDRRPTKLLVHWLLPIGSRRRQLWPL